MRKQLKNKKRACGLCKPHKRGGAKRWTPKDAARLKSAESEIREATRSMENPTRAGQDRARRDFGALGLLEDRPGGERGS